MTHQLPLPIVGGVSTAALFLGLLISALYIVTRPIEPAPSSTMYIANIPGYHLDWAATRYTGLDTVFVGRLPGFINIPIAQEAWQDDRATSDAYLIEANARPGANVTVTLAGLLQYGSLCVPANVCGRLAPVPVTTWHSILPCSGAVDFAGIACVDPVTRQLVGDCLVMSALSLLDCEPESTCPLPVVLQPALPADLVQLWPWPSSPATFSAYTGIEFNLSTLSAVPSLPLPDIVLTDIGPAHGCNISVFTALPNRFSVDITTHPIPLDLVFSTKPRDAVTAGTWRPLRVSFRLCTATCPCFNPVTTCTATTTTTTTTSTTPTPGTTTSCTVAAIPAPIIAFSVMQGMEWPDTPSDIPEPLSAFVGLQPVDAGLWESAVLKCVQYISYMGSSAGGSPAAFFAGCTCQLYIPFENVNIILLRTPDGNRPLFIVASALYTPAQKGKRIVGYKYIYEGSVLLAREDVSGYMSTAEGLLLEIDEPDDGWARGVLYYTDRTNTPQPPFIYNSDQKSRDYPAEFLYKDQVDPAAYTAFTETVLAAKVVWAYGDNAPALPITPNYLEEPFGRGFDDSQNANMFNWTTGDILAITNYSPIGRAPHLIVALPWYLQAYNSTPVSEAYFAPVAYYKWAHAAFMAMGQGVVASEYDPGIYYIYSHNCDPLAITTHGSSLYQVLADPLSIPSSYIQNHSVT